MVKEHKIEKIITCTVIDEVICNRCGRSFSGYIHCGEDSLEIHRFTGGGGYYSKIGDQTVWDFDICDDCLIEWLKTFKHNPVKFYDSYTEEVEIKSTQD